MSDQLASGLRDELITSELARDLQAVDASRVVASPLSESEAIERRLAHRPELVALFHEAEGGESPEAAFLALADKLDMGVMAERYRALGHDTSEFARSAAAATRRLIGDDGKG